MVRKAKQASLKKQSNRQLINRMKRLNEELKVAVRKNQEGRIKKIKKEIQKTRAAQKVKIPAWRKK